MQIQQPKRVDTMRNIFFAGLINAALATAPAQAQNSLNSTMSPPSPNASNAGAMSDNSLPLKAPMTHVSLAASCS